MSAAPHILIAEDEHVSSLVLQRLLVKAGYEVTVVRDGKQALHHAQKNAYAAMIVDWMLPELDGIEVVRTISTSNLDHKPKMLLCSVIDIPAAQEYAVAAGAHAFLPKPIVPAKLLEVLKGAAPAGAQSVAVGTHPLTRTHAWQMLAKSVSDPIGELLATTVSGDVCKGLPPEEARCFTGSLVDAARGVELLTTVVATSEAARAVAMQMLGEETSDVEVGDALGEIVNVVVGVLKTAFAQDGFSFTLGLPVSTTLPELEKQRATALGSCAIALKMGSTRFHVGFTIVANGFLEMKAEELREGLVLAEDVRNRTGALLLPACTRLTGAAAQRLRENCAGMKVKVSATSGSMR